MKKSTVTGAVLLFAAIAALLLLVGHRPPVIIKAIAPTPAAHLSTHPATAPPTRERSDGGATRLTAAQWEARMTDGTKPLEVVKMALPAAKAGDARAAFEIASILQSCAREMSSADPEAQLQQDLAQMQKVPQWLIEREERGARRCIEFAKGLAKENPFGDLPATSEYWTAEAYRLHDPLAQVDKAREAMGDIVVDPKMPEAVRAEKAEIVQDNLRAVVESGDLNALFNAGIMMANPYVSTDTMRGFSVALAACDLGFNDCENLNHECVQSGFCPPGQDFATQLQHSLGAEQYAQLYARSQQIVEAVRAQDFDAVLANLTMDQSPAARADLAKRVADIQEKENRRVVVDGTRAASQD
jgi:hypothetical protein